MKRLAAIVILCGGAAACSSSTEPSRSTSVHVELEQQAGDTLTATARAATGGAIVEGSVPSVCIGLPLTATAQRTDSIVELNVLPTPRPNCNTGTQSVRYQATLSLSPGGYTIVVQHGVAGLWQQVLRQFVRVE